MSAAFKAFAGAAALLFAGAALAAGGDLGQVDKQPTNWVAIGMFSLFVIATLYITKWAAAKTKSAADTMSVSASTKWAGRTNASSTRAMVNDYSSC